MFGMNDSGTYSALERVMLSTKFNFHLVIILKVTL